MRFLELSEASSPKENAEILIQLKCYEYAADFYDRESDIFQLYLNVLTSLDVKNPQAQVSCIDHFLQYQEVYEQKFLMFTSFVHAFKKTSTDKNRLGRLEAIDQILEAEVSSRNPDWISTLKGVFQGALRNLFG